MENSGQNRFGMFVKIQSWVGWKHKPIERVVCVSKNILPKLFLPSTDNTTHQHQAYCPIAHIDKNIFPAFSLEKSVGTNNW